MSLVILLGQLDHWRLYAQDYLYLESGVLDTAPWLHPPKCRLGDNTKAMLRQKTRMAT